MAGRRPGVEVANPAVRAPERAMTPSDKLASSQVMNVRSAVGSATVTSARGAHGKELNEGVMVTQQLLSAVPLAEIRANMFHRDSILVRHGRVSVVSRCEDLRC